MSPPAFGPWIVDRPIGRGASATVYRCHAADDPLRLAAVKVLHGAEGAPAQVARLAREVRVLRRLDHPGIVGVLDADTRAAEPWVALELVDGVPLDRARPGARPAAEVLGLARAVAEALAHAHRVGVFHRDVKPANLLVERAGRVRVVDFGISAARGESTLTDPGAAAPGTIDYAPPEWFRRRSEELDPPRLDAYALGVVLYEQLTGRRAFVSQGPRGLATVLAQKAATDCLDPGPDAPEVLRAVIRGTTRADPRRRTTLEEVLQTLEAEPLPAPTRSEWIRVQVPTDRFVGRTRELAEIRSFPATVRLVTLVGPPGVGKSRLARELCAAAGPTPWVELSEVTNLAGALRAASVALGCAPTLEAATERLRTGPWRQVLLDDADRVLAPLRTILGQAFRDTPNVRWIVTSRERLRIGGERVVTVAPLAVPTDDEPADAARLLAERVAERGAVPLSDGDAARVVRALDGLPLAIELAAAQVAPGVPIEALGHDGSLERALGGAWNQLDAEEQSVAAACAVFQGPFGLALAEDVVDAGARPRFEVLQGLVDKSWVQVRRGQGAFVVLRTLRTFLHGRLAASGALRPVSERHAFAFARLADEPRAPTPVDVANALAAFDWALDAGEPALAVTLGVVVASGSGDATHRAWAERAAALLATGAGAERDRERLRARLRRP